MTLADVNASIDESVQYMNGVDEREAPVLLRVLLLLLLLLIPIAPADTLADTAYGDGERKRRSLREGPSLLPTSVDVLNVEA